MAESLELGGDERRSVRKATAHVVLPLSQEGGDVRCHSEAMSTDAVPVKLGEVPPRVSTMRT